MKQEVNSGFQDLPMVSILILNYNGEPYVERCLNSLLDQSYSNFEVIMVDNGSSDNSLQILKEYVPQIKLILNDKNLGFAGGNNVGIKEASGEFIVLFNNDAIADKDWLSNLVKGGLDMPEADIVSGPIYYYEPKDVIWCAGAHLDMITGLAWHLGQYETEFDPHSDIDYFPGCALLIRREVFEKIGLLDERFFLYAEDPDFCLRAKRERFKLKLVPEAKVWHMVSMGMKAEPSRVQHQKLKSEFRLILKLWPLWCLPLTVFLRLTAIPLAEILFLQQSKKHLFSTWHAFFSAFGNEPRKEQSYPWARLGSPPLHNRLAEGLRLLRKRNIKTYEGIPAE